MHCEHIYCSINIARPPPILITKSLTIRTANIAMPVTSKILLIFLPQSEHWLLIESNLQVIRLMSPGMDWLSAHNKFYMSPLVCINPKPLSSITGNTDIDFLSSHLPTSPPISPVLNVGLLSGDTQMTAACEIPLNLFPIKLMLTSSILISQLIRLKVLCKELLICCNILLLSLLVYACSKSLYSISDNSV